MNVCIALALAQLCLCNNILNSPASAQRPLLQLSVQVCRLPNHLNQRNIPHSGQQSHLLQSLQTNQYHLVHFVFVYTGNRDTCGKNCQTSLSFAWLVRGVMTISLMSIVSCWNVVPYLMNSDSFNSHNTLFLVSAKYQIPHRCYQNLLSGEHVIGSL